MRIQKKRKIEGAWQELLPSFLPNDNQDEDRNLHFPLFFFSQLTDSDNHLGRGLSRRWVRCALGGGEYKIIYQGIKVVRGTWEEETHLLQ